MSDTQHSDALVLKKLKQDVFDYIKLRLGGNMVDVELDPEHYDMALDRAVSVYRYRSTGGGVEEAYAFLQLQRNVQEYTLPNEIVAVREIFRRNIGSGAMQDGELVEPFEMAWINTYLLGAAEITGGLLSYELYTNYRNLTSKMFGGYINFSYNPVTHKLSIVRRPDASGETVMLWCHTLRPLFQLLTDYLSAAWIREYAMNVAKHTLGEAREKYTSIVGPGGGTSLNGASLKSEATAEMDRLDKELLVHAAGGTPLGFLFG
jgi:hypothetical protein